MFTFDFYVKGKVMNKPNLNLLEYSCLFEWWKNTFIVPKSRSLNLRCMVCMWIKYEIATCVAALLKTVDFA